jgi:hypothetical protein
MSFSSILNNKSSVNKLPLGPRQIWSHFLAMEQHAFKNINNYLNTYFYSYLETSVGQSSNSYLYVVHFFQHQSLLEIYGSLRHLFPCIGV